MQQTYTKEQAKEKIAKLVEHFAQTISNYNIDESETREFIDNFFYYLGWHVNNRELRSSEGRVVKKEKRVSTFTAFEYPDGLYGKEKKPIAVCSNKKADYSFC